MDEAERGALPSPITRPSPLTASMASDSLMAFDPLILPTPSRALILPPPAHPAVPSSAPRSPPHVADTHHRIHPPIAAHCPPDRCPNHPFPTASRCPPPPPHVRRPRRAPPAASCSARAPPTPRAAAPQPCPRAGRLRVAPGVRAHRRLPSARWPELQRLADGDDGAARRRRCHGHV